MFVCYFESSISSYHFILEDADIQFRVKYSKYKMQIKKSVGMCNE